MIVDDLKVNRRKGKHLSENHFAAEMHVGKV